MNTTTTPKDFFLHLGATVALYAVAISLINLLFAVINYLVPDALASYFYAPSVAWPISMLIVLVPVLYLLEWAIARGIRIVPEKASLFIRRWRIYLTLFLAGATIIGDVIALINTYLSGEITMRFVWKILAILVVCGIIFAYYLLQRTDTDQKKTKVSMILAWAGIVVSLVAIITGFIVVGSPGTQRALRFDEQRVNDLTNIQWNILNYWEKTGKLPVAITELNDPVSGIVLPTDPQTKTAYEYSVKGVNGFELCATFSLPSRDMTGRGAYDNGYSVAKPASYPLLGTDDLWVHEKGKKCFERNIDPAKHPLLPNVK